MIKEDIQKRIISSLKEHKTVETNVLRFLLSMIKYAEIEKKSDLTDDEVLALFTKEVKKRKESIAMYSKAGRTDLVDEEKTQLQFIEAFLPQGLTEEEVKKIVVTVLANTPDHTNQGRLIGAVMGQVKGRADGTLVARLVQEELKK
jgi:uncharacterized protein YqeY